MMTTSPEEIFGPLNDLEIKYLPKEIYASGRIELLRQSPRVAVIGSRDASDEALERTRDLVRKFVSNQVVIVSGLARGIDTAAHTTAIADGGTTIAVLGTPLNVVTPRSNARLQDMIMREHLAISQFAPGISVQPKNFPMRNRTMALICQASVIVQAGATSGSVSQGWEALRLGRQLFITEEIVEDESLRWPMEMIDYGAQVLYDDVDIVLESLPAPGREEAYRHAL